ncbi:DUF3047 domain-containing protein [Oryzomonas rubra]|uniref:DUF3047 domain-containing protein n=1 Tax=Oryzomonas rubra TaxID=2509454 RepID=A0A5A9XPY8_9BACT|nr:DUF3047 domain-containing protein [Oryzomonas rubra]KAA0895146.1 DUF3047 domain-containing protein [Oryzomonas rubra]
MTGHILLALALTAFCTVAQATEYHVGAFSTEGLHGWETKIFKGTTAYSLVQDAGRTVVKAASRGTASGLFKKVKLDPEQFRYLRWSWKVGGIVKNGDETTKNGDDHAARIYVVFSSRLFWRTKAINYIWANRLAKGDAIPNAFTSHAMMLAVESGPERVGHWINEERDILADYRRLFGGEPHEIDAIAIMTDTDNTGGEATAWYGDITLSTGK